MRIKFILASDEWKQRLKHFMYAGGWKKFEPLWNFVIKTHGLNKMLPLREAILSRVKRDDRRTENISPFPAIA